MIFIWDEAKRQTNLRKHGFLTSQMSKASLKATLLRSKTIALTTVRCVLLHSDCYKAWSSTPRKSPWFVSFPCEKLTNMNKNSTSKASQTDWDRVRAMSDDEIDYSDIPQITEEQMKRAVHRFGGKVVSRQKVRVNIYLDAGVVAYFKSLAGGRGYQVLINETLKESMRTTELEGMLRRVVREELAAQHT